MLGDVGKDDSGVVVGQDKVVGEFECMGALFGDFRNLAAVDDNSGGVAI